jgi:membrane protein DedA with SNARE-associated domain
MSKRYCMKEFSFNRPPCGEGLSFYPLAIAMVLGLKLTIKEPVNIISMTFQSSLETYGFLAILIGSFIEGETILVLGGFAAQRGYLQLPWVILFAFLGSLTGDQLFFHLGRLQSQQILAKHPRRWERVDKAHNALQRYKTPLILGFRFIYGMRIITPFVIGMSRVSAGYFILLNVIGAIFWAVVVGYLGYLFGSAAEALIGNLRQYEIEAMGIIVLIGTLFWLIHLFRSRKHRPGHI